MITQERLKKLLHYDPETGLFTRLVRVCNCVQVGDITGTKATGNYLRMMIDGSPYMLHRLAWLYMYGAWPKDEIDHINHVRDDNRILNLRNVNSTENGRNQKLHITNTSGVCGVFLRKNTNIWYVQMRIGGKNVHIGNFKNFDDAVFARKEAEIKHGYHKNHGNNLPHNPIRRE